jgi:DNA-binding beta-propeller fold protein YncE
MIHAKLKVFRVLSTALRSREGGRGASQSSPAPVLFSGRAGASPESPGAAPAGVAGKPSRSERRDLILPRAGAVERPFTRSVAGAQKGPIAAALWRLRTKPRAVSAAAGVAAVVAGTLLLAAPASALSKHTFDTSFSGSGSDVLSNPSDIAVDQSTGDVYVSDPADHRVEKFTSAGEFLLMFGKEVNATTQGDVCTASETCRPGTPGTTPGAFTDPLYLAVDNSPGGEGDVYVGDPGDALVSKFDSTGSLITIWGDQGQLDGSTATQGDFLGIPRLSKGLQAIAVGPRGTLFVVAGNQDQLYQFAQGGSFLTAEYFGSRMGAPIAVDPAENLFYAKTGTLGLPIGKALPTFEKKNVFRSGEAGLLDKGRPNYEEAGTLSPLEAAGLSVDPLTRALYATQDGAVSQFSPTCTSELESCTPLETFGATDLSDPQGVAFDVKSAAVYVADTGEHRVAVFTAVPYLATATPSAATGKTPTEEILKGEVDPAEAGEVTGCHFEYAPRSAFEGGGGWAEATSVLCEPEKTTVKTAVTAEVTGLSYGTAYRFRLVAADATGPSASFTETFTTLPLAPAIGAESVSDAYAETATVNAQINPNGGDTTYRVAYVTQEQFEKLGFAEALVSPKLDAGSARAPQSLTAPLGDLTPGTTYHYRVLATNECEAGVECTTEGEARTFTTLPFGPIEEKRCPNADVRQQTSAAGLLDCRAYELVSAANAGGYDVESDLIEGQTPFGGYPQAQDRVLYGVHDGGIPGTDHPTNDGVDPYLAVRGPEGWSTEYVGIPADATPSTVPFGSPLLQADAGLDTFAFGGPGLCSPCFGEGVETGIPLHLPNGSLVQGMAGSTSEPEPEAKPDGFIAEPLSPDGTHFVFGSVTQFAEGGNENGEVSVYDRNLTTGETHVVSDTPEGEDEPLPCLQGATKCHSSAKISENNPNGIAELGISSDGSRVLVAQKVITDADGNVYWHLYMNVGDSDKTIDLTPGVIASPGGSGFKEGVLYAGMSADGSRVFFTTKDKLTTEANQDTDTGADLYEAEVTEAGATLTRLSTGEAGAGNTDACDPVPNKDGEHWNTIGSETNCGVLAIGGGGGVAATDGSIYFLSPERLQTGLGTENQPNLYLARPGSAPRFITTLSPEDSLVLDAVSEAATRHTADFQVTPSGEFAAFPSTLALAGGEEEPAGHTEVYRYGAATEMLDCASCNPSGARAEGDAGLASNGLSLTEDGRVFFNSTDPLVVADTDARQDVYEWSEPGAGNCEESSPAFSKSTGDCLALISAGTSTFDSGLLGAGANGANVYFFTRDSLTPQDKNGPTMKIYDAREGGGFPYAYPEVACKASDECHGPGSAAPGPLQVDSGTVTVPKEEPKACKKGFIHRHGKCVKKPKHDRKSSHKRHGKRAHHKRGGKK